MSNTEDYRVREVVGLLIQVLHGEYSDTRDLAQAQLALLGERGLPYLCAYLRKEISLEKDFVEYGSYSSNA